MKIIQETKATKITADLQKKVKSELEVPDPVNGEEVIAAAIKKEEDESEDTPGDDRGTSS